jgi:hypothetical protein
MQALFWEIFDEQLAFFLKTNAIIDVQRIN